MKFDKNRKKNPKRDSETNLEAWKTGAPLFSVLLQTEVVRIEIGTEKKGFLRNGEVGKLEEIEIEIDR